MNKVSSKTTEQELAELVQPDSQGNYPDEFFHDHRVWVRTKGVEEWVRSKLEMNVVVAYGQKGDLPRLSKTTMDLDARAVLIVTPSRLLLLNSSEWFHLSSIAHVSRQTLDQSSPERAFGYIPPYTGKHNVYHCLPPAHADTFIREVLRLGSVITDEITGEMHILMGFRRGYKGLDKYLDELVFPVSFDFGQGWLRPGYTSAVQIRAKNIIDRDYQPDSETWRFVLFNLESISG